jgi:hypothetical protein
MNTFHRAKLQYWNSCGRQYGYIYLYSLNRLRIRRQWRNLIIRLTNLVIKTKVLKLSTSSFPDFVEKMKMKRRCVGRLPNSSIRVSRFILISLLNPFSPGRQLVGWLLGGWLRHCWLVLWWLRGCWLVLWWLRGCWLGGLWLGWFWVVGSWSDVDSERTRGPFNPGRWQSVGGGGCRALLMCF